MRLRILLTSALMITCLILVSSIISLQVSNVCPAVSAQPSDGVLLIQSYEIQYDWTIEVPAVSDFNIKVEVGDIDPHTLVSLSFVLIWNPNLMTYIGFEERRSGNFVVDTSQIGNGKLIVSWNALSSSQYITLGTLLMQINFRCLELGSSPIKFEQGDWVEEDDTEFDFAELVGVTCNQIRPPIDPSSSVVGGYYFSKNKLDVFSPYLIAIGLLSSLIAVSLITKRKRIIKK
ncbi:MAG: hypothetical protein NWF08_00890 [Candidatus Bathyarchaeota archaeon]|nr:hypothetical protein [Candidatus Bathyarchaeota archaeon]